MCLQLFIPHDRKFLVINICRADCRDVDQIQNKAGGVDLLTPHPSLWCTLQLHDKTNDHIFVYASATVVSFGYLSLFLCVLQHV